MIQVYKEAFKARAMSLRARRVADFFFLGRFKNASRNHARVFVA
jgi:hypothetical protein